MIKKYLMFVIILLVLSLDISSTSIFGFIEIKKSDMINPEKVCGDKLCSPYHQFKLGSTINQILCNEGFELLRSVSNQPNCVKPESVERLLSMGWEQVVQEQIHVSKDDSSSENYEPLVEHSMIFPHQKNNLSIEISRDVIGDKNFIVFEGCCWHRLHNVEVTISNKSGIIDSVRSQTTDRGLLYMPWPISDDLISGLYHINANDGINNLEFNATILP